MHALQKKTKKNNDHMQAQHTAAAYINDYLMSNDINERHTHTASHPQR